MKKWLRNVLAIAVICLAGRARQTLASDATLLSLEWQPSPDSGVAGYALYYGPTGGSITNRIDVGPETAAIVKNLDFGVEYTFFVVAYDGDLNEGDPSEPLIYTTRPISPLTIFQPEDDDMTMRITFRVAPGAACRVEFTDSLMPPNWQLLATLTGDANGEVVIDDSMDQPSRFYRAALEQPAGE